MAEPDDRDDEIPTKLRIEVRLVPELWNLAAGWVNEHLVREGSGPTTNEVLGSAATLMHVAAMSWAIFEPPPEVAQLLQLDENTFVELARDMFRKAQQHRREGQGTSPAGASASASDGASASASDGASAGTSDGTDGEKATNGGGSNGGGTPPAEA